MPSPPICVEAKSASGFSPVDIVGGWAPIWTYFLDDAFKAIALADRVPEEAPKK